MPARSLSERIRDGWWWLEQAAHFVLGMVAALPAIWGPLPALTGVCAALIVAASREVEQRPVASWGDLAADVTFTALGGLVAGGIRQWVIPA